MLPASQSRINFVSYQPIGFTSEFLSSALIGGPRARIGD
jgi:hypothetical protein